MKRAVSGYAAESVHPTIAADRVRAGAKAAVKRATSARPGSARAPALQPLRIDPPIEIGIDFARAIQADVAAIVPGFRREGDRGVRYSSPDPIDAYRGFLAAVRLGSTIP